MELIDADVGPLDTRTLPSAFETPEILGFLTSTLTRFEDDRVFPVVGDFSIKPFFPSCSLLIPILFWLLLRPTLLFFSETGCLPLISFLMLGPDLKELLKSHTLPMSHKMSLTDEAEPMLLSHRQTRLQRGLQF